MHHLDPHVPQVIGRPNPGLHQQMGRGNGPGTQHYFRRLNHKAFAPALRLDPGDARAVEPQTQDRHIGFDRQVKTVPSLGQISQRRTHPHPIDIVHGKGANSSGIGVVHIGVGGKIGFQTSLVKRRWQRLPILLSMHAHR